ncbi:MAG: VCBS repeat-containing protein [Pirellulales bacterium]
MGKRQVADFDRDGDVDLFACNDGTANFYFENDGRGTFTEKAIEKGGGFLKKKKRQQQICRATASRW